MIRELIELQDAVNRRAQIVGRALQASKHYGCTEVPFPAVVTYIASFQSDGVDIAVGINGNKSTAVVRVPVQLFEAGTVDAVKLWVTQQNNIYTDAAARAQERQEDEIRQRDMQTLKELKSRYPDEFR